MNTPFAAKLMTPHSQIWLLVIALTATTASTAYAAPAWMDITSPLLERLTNEGRKPDWPGGCSGVVVNRLTGEVTVKVVGHGLWRSQDQGGTWKRVDGQTISGRDETGWATSADQNAPERLASFSLDGTAGWTSDGQVWRKFTDLGRNWDYGSVDWNSKDPGTIIAAKHETNPPGEVYATTDAGVHWKQLSIHLRESRGEISMIGALDSTTFIYSTGEGIQRSPDLGATWSKVSEANPQTRIPVLFGSTHYLGTATGLLVSKNKGMTWQGQGAPVDIWQGPFFGRNNQEMVIAGKDGVFKTKNAGETWDKVVELKAKEQGFLFTVDWFGCYAWDPVHDILYTSSMGNPVYKLQLALASSGRVLLAAETIDRQVPPNFSPQVATVSAQESILTEVLTYKRAAGRELKLFLEKPADWKPGDHRPAVLFFFGGAWVGGTPEQFRGQSRHFASRGMMGIRVEYRTLPKGDTGPPAACCADAKSAMRYVRGRAGELGIDPHRIAAAGGSAGGHLAAFTGLVEGLDDPADDLAISCKPQALVLFNPVFNNGPGQWGHQRVGDRYREFSPAHNISPEAPPTIVFLGDADRLIPVSVLRDFEEGMKKAGVRCDAHVYPKAGHGFFNREPHFTLTLEEADKFLTSLGWLDSLNPRSVGQ